MLHYAPLILFNANCILTDATEFKRFFSECLKNTTMSVKLVVGVKESFSTKKKRN